MLDGYRTPAEWQAHPGDVCVLRPLIEDDVAAAMRLGSLAAWNQTEEDWRFLLSAAPGGCFGAVRQGRVIGTAVARALSTAAMRPLAGRAVLMDVPAAQEAFLDWLRLLGFKEQRHFIRMTRGQGGPEGDPGLLYATAGPELG